MRDSEQKAKNRFFAAKNIYVTGMGQVITKLHAYNQDCKDFGCVIHNPLDYCMSSFPTFWRSDRSLMERICPHGVGHPELTHINFTRRLKGEKAAYYESIHGCCPESCCREVKPHVD